jgi:hypothetical protein
MSKIETKNVFLKTLLAFNGHQAINRARVWKKNNELANFMTKINVPFFGSYRHSLYSEDCTQG